MFHLKKEKKIEKRFELLRKFSIEFKIYNLSIEFVFLFVQIMATDKYIHSNQCSVVLYVVATNAKMTNATYWRPKDSQCVKKRFYKGVLYITI